MKGPKRSGRAGVTTGDFLVILSLLTLASSVIYPRVVAAAFQSDVSTLVAAIDAVRDAARAEWARTGSWPSESPPGTVPSELVASLPGDIILDGEGYVLSWNVWEAVAPPADDPTEELLEDHDPEMDTELPEIAMDTAPEGPQLLPLPFLTVEAEEEALLAALLAHYGRNRSFVYGSRWTLMLGQED